jgi:hypothetical protein
LKLAAVCLLLGLVTGCSSEESSNGASGGSANGGTGGSAGANDAGSDALLPPYQIPAFDAVRIGSDSNQPNFQEASTEIDFGTGPFEKVTMIVDLESTCYPFEKWQANPPPSGQNWPADCDAFDRNFEFYLDRPKAPATEPPGLELERAITPFGGPLHLEVDVTDVANGLPGKHDLTVHITTYSDGAGQVSGSNGGWNVSTHFEVTPGAAPRNVLKVISLFNGSQTSSDPLPALGFEAPEGTTSSRLEYRVTGHGGASTAGCSGPAEEFCIRTHALFVDGSVITDFVPWRDDCATLCTIAHTDVIGSGFDYCTENPCGSVASVKASRANWCPGSETPPFLVDAPALSTPGAHDFSWTISEVADGGTWRISATYFAFGN